MEEEERIARNIFKLESLEPKEVVNLFGFGSGDISKLELDYVRKIFGIIGPHIVRAVYNSPVANCKNSKDRKKCVERFLKKYPWHDLMHSVIEFEASSSLIPKFLTEEKEINNEIIYRAEIHALLWLNQFADFPTYVAFIDPTRTKQWCKALELVDLKNVPEQQIYVSDALNIADKIDHLNFESVFNSYQNFVALIMRSLTFFLINKKGLTLESERIISNYHKLTKHIISFPEERFERRARRIFDGYKNNSKILFEEFKDITSSLV